MTYVLYFVCWAVVLYLANSLFARKYKKINEKKLLVYVTTVALAGVYGEILLGTLYDSVFGKPLWEYQVYPIHNAYTSYLSIVVWSLYGFHMYLLHDTLKKKKIFKPRQLTIIFSFEAILFEILVNLTFLATFGTYLFYYLPSDLWHLTSIQVIPFYAFGGFVIIKTINHFKVDPLFFSFLTFLLLTAVVVTA